MVEIRFIVPTDKFERDVRKIKDESLKVEQIDRVAEDPASGKLLR